MAIDSQASNPSMTVEEFDKLPKSVQRVMVAKDVISRLNTGFYIADTSTYVQRYGSRVKYSANVRDNFEAYNNCAVCAWGACLLSTIYFKNQATFEDVEDKVLDHLPINQVFSRYQQYLIETAYMASNSEIYLTTDNLPWYLRMWVWTGLIDGSRFKARTRSKDRMIDIMNNIINNNGTFKPWKKSIS